MKACVTVLVILAAACLAVAFYFFTGRYNVAATSPHWSITTDVLAATRDQSIRRQSENISMPQPSSSPELRKIGFHHYHEMCRLCHGAPGYQRSEFARGLYPGPPHLASRTVLNEWDDAQLYWIIKNGIRMTGMPSFGVTHTEKEMLGVVSFLRLLPNLKPDDYALLVKSFAKESKE